MMIIRSAGPEDAEAVEDARGRSWRAAYEGLLPRTMIEELTGPAAVERRRQWAAANPRGRTLLAEVSGAPAGMAAYGPERHPPEGPLIGRSRVELYSIYVAPDHWAAGVGRALMDRVVEECRKAGHDRLVLWVLTTNARARRFYDRAGFTEEGHRDYDMAGHIIPETRYERPLTPSAP
ncbi:MULTISPECIES: GNAT family N-acetyltransferase [Actinomadura]|uniref:GNAT family N-acetyltransferase n=1 Tax=Actinomadura yumaensis TaxID=111807 RepID=A0ABW2CJ97_9ACTN|nr:GNAT family N-acetyltransferase [Actinomadura sp. J1-007]MWK33184.1 GNAT family N-acetyltransferase [Actinomadura sp. J1-007]